jgi:hypothetical protein
MDEALSHAVADDPTQVSGRSGPSPFYLTGEDALRVQSWGSVAGVTLWIVGRRLTIDGEIKPFAERHVPNSDRSLATTYHGIGTGWILTASVYAAAGSPRRGQVFCIVDVQRGLTSAGQIIGTLVHDYVTDTQRLTWPGSHVNMSTDGRGALLSVAGNDPAAGAEVAVTVPTNARWRLRSLVLALTTSAAVANREVAVNIDDGANVLAHVPARYTHTAGLARVYTFAPGLTSAVAAQDTGVCVPIPDLDLLQGWRITTATSGKDAGDDYAAPRLLVEEWIED